MLKNLFLFLFLVFSNYMYAYTIEWLEDEDIKMDWYDAKEYWALHPFTVIKNFL